MNKKPFQLCLLLAGVMIAMAPSAFSQTIEEQYYCQTIYDAKHNGAVRPPVVAPCGNTCPEVVKQQGPFIQPESLPADGFFIYNDDKKGIYKSPLNEFKPELIPNTENDNIFDSELSPDGNWILYGLKDSKKMALIKIDGTNKTIYDKEVYSITWVRNSPTGKTEVAYTYDTRNVMVEAVEVNLSGGAASFGNARTIGRKLGNHYGRELSVGGEFLYIRLNRNAGEAKKSNPGILFTIPEGGLGTALADHDYDVKFPYNCAMTLNPAADKLCNNVGRSYSDCIADGHQGFNILEVKRHDEPEITPASWYLEEAVSINWASEEIRFKQGDLHHYNWTAHEEWIAGADIAGKMGIFLIHWPTNSWYPLSGDPLSGEKRNFFNPSVHIPQNHQSSIPYFPTGVPKSDNSDFYRNILGKKVPSAIILPAFPAPGY